MGRKINACLICQEELIYFDEAKAMECDLCHETFESYASCRNGHFVCDSCHAKKGVEAVIRGCMDSQEADPVRLLQELMEDPFIYMHGPEHHIMVGSALLTAYHNAGGFSGDREAFLKALAEMKSRGSRYPGGSCGFWGCCGAAVSTGMFYSIITGTTPLSGKSWGDANAMTAKALGAISDLGGPRCCKRNSFTAALTAIDHVKDVLGIEMKRPEKITCEFSEENKQCIRKKCPYYKG